MTPRSERIDEMLADDLLAEVLGFETRELAASAFGASIRAHSGRDFLDFTGGIAVHACGHNHSAVVGAIRRQAESLLHVSDTMRHEPQLALADWLRTKFANVLPGEPFQFLMLNSGSESIDAAAKLAMKVTGRHEFAAFEGAFHGRTMMATALSCSKRLHWQAYDPYISMMRDKVTHLPVPRAARRNALGGPDRCIAALRKLFHEKGSQLAAVFFEGQQGEGGYFPMDFDVAQEMQRLARQFGVLVIADEIQAGCGRTGRWFSFEHLNIEPDIVVFGKAIGGGLPLAGLGARRSLMSQWLPGEHGSTFGGNPVSCAAGLAALQTIDEQGLLQNAAEMGMVATEMIKPLLDTCGLTDVRGYGLMLAIELRDGNGYPDYARCELVKSEARRNGLMLLTCGARIGKPQTDCAAIRIIPPLNIDRGTITHGITTLIHALVSVPVLTSG